METLAPGQGGAVHIWLEWIDTAPEPEGLPILDDDERARAGRLRFERDRRRFVARRAFRRRILGEHLGIEPVSVRYRRSANGKPELLGATGLAFSASHSDGLAIVAVTTQGEVGVDIERVRPMPDALNIARRFFAAREYEHLRSVPAGTRSEAFLRLWTAKEACIKLVGRGLSMPLDDFEVLEWGGGDVIRLGGVDGAPSIRLFSVDVPAGYVASVAATAAAVIAGPPQLAIAS
jgi:4'-phosphopantetheinyl transferase